MSTTTTRKSFKSSARDKPSHSDKGNVVTKKGGAGGKGTWGNPKDDIKYADEDGHAMDEADPNFDPIDPSEGNYMLAAYTPTEETRRMFTNSISDLANFKAGVKDALQEYMVSHVYEEFSSCVADTKYAIYHQDLPAILIKCALDKDEKDRNLISHLLQTLRKNDVLSISQMTQGFKKVLQSIGDLCVDFPNAKAIVSEFVGHGLAAGYIDGKVIAKLEEEALDANSLPMLKGTKAKINSAVKEYFTCTLLPEFEESVKEVKPSLHFEVVKRLLSLAMDLSNKERELANAALASLAGSIITQDQAIKGVTILLGRVEDIYLDVPDVLRLLSCMVARAISDEVLPPSFLLRLDLAEGDMGLQVAKEAQSFLNQPHAAKKLERVWL